MTYAESKSLIGIGISLKKINAERYKAYMEFTPCCCVKTCYDAERDGYDFNTIRTIVQCLKCKHLGLPLIVSSGNRKAPPTPPPTRTIKEGLDWDSAMLFILIALCIFGIILGGILK